MYHEREKNEHDFAEDYGIKITGAERVAPRQPQPQAGPTNTIVPPPPPRSLHARYFVEVVKKHSSGNNSSPRKEKGSEDNGQRAQPSPVTSRGSFDVDSSKAGGGGGSRIANSEAGGGVSAGGFRRLPSTAGVTEGGGKGLGNAATGEEERLAFAML